MVRRISASLALIVFTMCLIQGVQAENSFRTVVGRALLALVVTMIVGMILGMALEKMLLETAMRPEKPDNSSNDAAMLADKAK